MSQRDVERALGRLVTDPGFRYDFFNDPAGACVLLGLQLTPQELEALLRTSQRALAKLSDGLDDRICRVHAPGPDAPARGRVSGS
jgi:hypothetical protein